MTESEQKVIPPQPLDAWFLDLLECVGCDKHLPVHLNESQLALVCHCGRYAFPVRDGIPIMLIEEAEELDPNARPVDAPEADSRKAGD